MRPPETMKLLVPMLMAVSALALSLPPKTSAAPTLQQNDSKGVVRAPAQIGSEREPRPCRPTVQRAALPAEAHKLVEALNVKDADLRDVLRALGSEHNLNIAVDNEIAQRVTVRLANISVIDALVFLCEEYGVALEQRGSVLRVSQQQEIPPSPMPVNVIVRDSLLTVDLSGDDVHAVARAVTEMSRMNVLVSQDVSGTLTGYLQDVPLEPGFRTILESNGFSLARRGGIYHVSRPDPTHEEFSPRETAIRLIRLRHIRSEGLAERLPEYLRQNGAFQVIKEQNGIVAIGSADLIAQTEAFIGQIDIPAPQVLIEALVVDFEETDLVQLGISFGRDARPDVPGGYGFGGGEDQRGGYTWEGGGDRATNMLSYWSGLVGLGSIGRLPSDFYLRLQALVHEGKAEVRSRPRIATLNGHTASISVGTTQYYILKSVVGYPIPGQPGAGEVEHFERVEANVSLEITPWVSTSGEVTAEIRPEFATPVGGLDPRIPPTINNRVVNTTVRLRDGETVIIGGLIQEMRSSSYNKIPILGNLPLLGHLFRNRRHDVRKSELVIFITPHVFYGGD